MIQFSRELPFNVMFLFDITAIFSICDFLWSITVRRTCGVQYYISYQLDLLREKQSAF